MSVEPPPVRIPKEIRVVKSGAGPARLYIDGELFPWATADGFTVHPKRDHMPGVALTIAAYRVEVVDELDVRGELRT